MILYKRLIFQIVLIAGILFSPDYIEAQTPRETLIKIAEKDASFYGDVVAIDDSLRNKFVRTFVNHALTLEKALTSPDKVSLKRVYTMADKSRNKTLKIILNEEQYELLSYIIAQDVQQKRVEYNRLLTLIEHKEPLNTQIDELYSQKIMPKLIEYRQNLEKQIKTRDKLALLDIRYRIDTLFQKADTMDTDSMMILSDLATTKREIKAVKTLNKIHKRYNEELDYISASLISLERVWRGDYLKILKENLVDEDYIQLATIDFRSNALGYDYFINQIVMLLLDPKKSLEYVDTKQDLSKFLIVKN